MTQARLAIDIGGTFTDFAIEVGGQRHSVKVLTTPRAPEEGVLSGIDQILAHARLEPADIGIIIHGTTLATNAIIERKGARTAMVVTEGFRDSIEMAFENRFEQYDIYMDKPPPLVPRDLRFGVRERLDGRGNVLLPLDEAAVASLVPKLDAANIEAVAIGYMHAYLDGSHERRTRDILLAHRPDLSVTLASEVSPEIREYERWSTAIANAYVQPVMDRYLGRLDGALKQRGFPCPLLLITSGGGLTTIETARKFPIRLVESGPAGGAILAASLAQQYALGKVLSFDMGGTTAKICLIDEGEPQHSRTFEVARGSIASSRAAACRCAFPSSKWWRSVPAGDRSRRSTASRASMSDRKARARSRGPPAMAAAEASPRSPTADVVLGRLDPDYFAGGSIKLDGARAVTAIDKAIGQPLGLRRLEAAFGISEVVEENMANAARVHAVERGKDLEARTLIAFGGAAPLHAARLADKLSIRRVLIPSGAGVGSAFGFLRAPVAYEVARSRYVRLGDRFDPDFVNALFDEMRTEAEAVVRAGAPDATLVETRAADMRYTGQGHEITVGLPLGRFDVTLKLQLVERYERDYAAAFGRTIPGLEVEIMNWTLRLAARTDSAVAAVPAAQQSNGRQSRARRALSLRRTSWRCRMLQSITATI